MKKKHKKLPETANRNFPVEKKIKEEEYSEKSNTINDDPEYPFEEPETSASTDKKPDEKI